MEAQAPELSNIEKKEQAYQAFLNFHKSQLDGMGMPEELRKRLYNKI